MNGLFVGILAALGIGVGVAAWYGIGRLGTLVKEWGEGAGKWLGEKYDNATKPIREAYDSLKEQAGQSAYDRSGGPKPGENYYTELARKEYRDARRKREAENEKKPPASRAEALREQIKTAEQNQAAGVFDGDVFLTIEQLKTELATLEGNR